MPSRWLHLVLTSDKQTCVYGSWKCICMRWAPGPSIRQVENLSLLVLRAAAACLIFFIRRDFKSECVDF